MISARKTIPRAVALALLTARLASPPVWGASLMDELGDAVKDGNVRLTLHLAPGQVAINPSWDLRVEKVTAASVLLTANDGKLSELHFRAPDGSLVLVGHGLYPNIVIEEIDAAGEKGITGARFHGRGFGRLVVSLFRKTAMKAVAKMRFHDDLASLFRGDILMPAATPDHGKTAAPARGPAPAPEAKGPSLFDLVQTLEIRDSTLTAFGGRRLTFEPAIAFATAPGKQEALSVRLDFLAYTPARGDAGSRFEMKAGLDGSLADGTMAFGGDRIAFSRGTLQGGELDLRTGEPASVAFSAKGIALTLSSGRLLVPGGLRITVDRGSTFSAREFRLDEAARVSGILNLDLKGRTGDWARAGTVAAMESVDLHARGLTLRNNEATGEVEMSFQYRLEYPLVVKYPVPEIAERRVMLDFRGTLQGKLALEKAGGPGGRVRGMYSLRVPWAPVEKAALEVLRAKWTQDVRPVFRKVDITVDPSSFGPCGTECFLAKFKVTVDKKSGKTSLFHEECAPQGQAKLEIDKATRSVVLRDVKLEPHCQGVTGWVVNRIAPLFAKVYSDVTVLKVPESFPFSIDEVKSGMNWIEVAGKIDWEEGGGG